MKRLAILAAFALVIGVGGTTAAVADPCTGPNCSARPEPDESIRPQASPSTNLQVAEPCSGPNCSARPEPDESQPA
jgi:hypothetical protein